MVDRFTGGFGPRCTPVSFCFYGAAVGRYFLLTLQQLTQLFSYQTTKSYTHSAHTHATKNILRNRLNNCFFDLPHTHGAAPTHVYLITYTGHDHLAKQGL